MTLFAQPLTHPRPLLALRIAALVLALIAAVTALHRVAPSEIVNFGPIHYGEEDLNATLADLETIATDVNILQQKVADGLIDPVKKTDLTHIAIYMEEAKMAAVEVAEGIEEIHAAAALGKGASAGMIANLKSAVKELEESLPMLVTEGKAVGAIEEVKSMLQEAVASVKQVLGV